MINIAIEIHKDKNENMYIYEADLFKKVHLGGTKASSVKGI